MKHCFWSALLCAAGMQAAAGNSSIGDACERDVLYSAKQSSAVTWENDALSVGRVKTDEYYTQGMRLSYTYEVPEPQPLDTETVRRAASSGLNAVLKRWNQFFCEHRPRWEASNATPVFRSQTIFFGQHLFTPENITLPDPPLDDRPYAAWLYIGADLSSIVAWDTWATYYNVEFQIGMVGPPAQGKWVQTQFHKLIGAHLPQGWSTQIPAEPGVFASYRIDWRRRPESLFGHSGWEWDAIPTAEIGLGTIQDYLQAGGQIRFGRNLHDPIHYLTPTRELLKLKEATQPELAAVGSEASAAEGRYNAKVKGAGWLGEERDECFRLLHIKECEVSAGVVGRLVGRNVFLDGTLFSDSRSVNKTPAYYDLMAGFRFRWSAFSLDYQFIRRSKEFTPVPAMAINRDGHHDFGSVTGRCEGDATIWCPLFVGALLVAMAFQ